MSKYSAKINVQLIAETFYNLGVEDIVISPGSRNGALTMQLVNDKRFNCYSIVDERCAAYTALGMAIQMQKPVVITCTSGSAAANYYPAITEAFYQNIPLIVLTADRPADYTDLFDGQTIRQENLFQKHSYYNTQLQEEEDEQSITDNFLKIKETVHQAIINQGPVHINMPFSEPLYESVSEKLIEFDSIGKPKKNNPKIDWVSLQKEYQSCEKIMILTGQLNPDKDLEKLIQQTNSYKNIVVLTETTSNLHSDKNIAQIDAVLRHIHPNEKDAFQPDLLITLGQSVISKKIKNFLRENSPRFHWHIDLHWHPNTYFTLTQKVHCDAKTFLTEFLIRISPKKSNYQSLWLDKERKNQNHQHKFYENLVWSDLLVFKEVIASYPSNYVVHYSNSSVIRYSQLFQHQKVNPIFCNRGTSGIDGSTSTAIGFAMKSEKPTILVTGDISFFYDSNALWNSNIPNTFRIILINNGGGNIFKIIHGPDSTNALEKFFETKHQLNATHLCAMFGFEYHCVNNQESLSDVLKQFYKASNHPKLLEIDTKNAENAEILHQFMEI